MTTRQALYLAVDEMNKSFKERRLHIFFREEKELFMSDGKNECVKVSVIIVENQYNVYIAKAEHLYWVHDSKPHEEIEKAFVKMLTHLTTISVTDLLTKSDIKEKYEKEQRARKRQKKGKKTITARIKEAYYTLYNFATNKKAN